MVVSSKGPYHVFYKDRYPSKYQGKKALQQWRFYSSYWSMAKASNAAESLQIMYGVYTRITKSSGAK